MYGMPLSEAMYGMPLSQAMYGMPLSEAVYGMPLLEVMYGIPLSGTLVLATRVRFPYGMLTQGKPLKVD